MFRWLVNVGFLAFPIAATLGILLGLQAHREASGQTPLFVPPLDNKWVEKTYCQKSMGIHPETKGQIYTLNPNQWAYKEGDPGFLCMNVTTYNNQTYATKTTAPQFNVVWQYPQVEEQPVHAYPNIKVDGDLLPVKLESVIAMDVDMSWTMRVDNKTGTSTSTQELKAANVNSNVAIDMFIDSDKSKAGDSAKAGFEVMVWFASIGPATFAIGQVNGTVATKTVGGTKFDLYYGKNPNTGQRVLTWKAATTAYNFNGDLSPLVEEILQSKKPDYPTKADYLGYFSFGSEAYHSNKPVTFSVPSLSIDIRTS